ncbi:Na+/H+ antiporter subunit E [Aeromicrobium sp. CF4.19]|uniref:Na+/H+ antiporter subunit E n=1 Tax=Aeromicrobium sp. CF4.19 TaxID=3373082 RepID=UPI003EE733AC
MNGRWPQVIGLGVIWILMWGELTPTIVVGGLLAAFFVVVVFPFPRAPWRWTVRPWPTLVLLARFVVDLVRASIEVSWLALRPSPPPPSAVLRVDLRTSSELLMTITAELVSLVPGSLIIELDPSQHSLFLHVLDARSPERIDRARRFVLLQEDRVVRALAPRDERDSLLAQESAA